MSGAHAIRVRRPTGPGRRTGLGVALCAGVAAGLGAGPGLADPVAEAEQRLVVEALVICGTRAIGAEGGTNVDFVGGALPELRILQLVDDQSAVPLGARLNVSVPAQCNGPHRLVISSRNGGLLTATPAGGDGEFRSRLPYVVRAEWAGGSGTLVADSPGDSLSIQIDEALASTAFFEIEVPSGGAPLVAGAYADDLTITFESLP